MFGYFKPQDTIPEGSQKFSVSVSVTADPFRTRTEFIRLFEDRAHLKQKGKHSCVCLFVLSNCYYLFFSN